MRNPRHLFILVGFLAQSLTWDSYGFALASSLLWLLAVTWAHDKLPLGLRSEAIALLLGCAASALISKALSRSAHFFIGDGLVALQVVRLLRTLNRREKLTSVVVACFHIGVLCTLAPDLRFLGLFFAALYLLPGALKDAFFDRELTPCTARTSVPPSIQLFPTMRVCLWLLLGSVFVFLAFPRFTGSPLQLRDGFADQASLLDTILDPRRGGRANSPEVLLQVEGVDIGNLRCFALTKFDGIQWKADPTARLRQTPWLARPDVEHKPRFLFRKVYAKNSHYLGRMVPVDGKPVYMEQSFFTHPGRNIMSDALEAHSMWTTANNTYEYFIDSRSPPDILPPEVRQELLFAPPQSQRLTAWLNQITRLGTNSLHRARLVERHLRNNFRYEIGTPELSRLEPVDDFIFNRQEGHCERFAASMALFLRMQGIPSRIAIGYVPTSRNMFSGRMQVRMRDAHSWVEGYFDGLGWVSFDATPGPPPGGQTSDLLSVLEEAQFAWYSHVVNFNGFAQRDLMSAFARWVEKLPPTVSRISCWLLILLLVGLLLRSSRIRMRIDWRFGRRQRRSRREAAARHYYDEMLNLFRKKGLDRTEAQTPLEFLQTLQDRSRPGYPEASVVTDHFCQSYYGSKELTPEQNSATQEALARLKRESATGHASHNQVERS